MVEELVVLDKIKETVEAVAVPVSGVVAAVVDMLTLADQAAAAVVAAQELFLVLGPILFLSKVVMDIQDLLLPETLVTHIMLVVVVVLIKMDLLFLSTHK
tara:strand:+ start:493 stop:792 length:300 start_codon:yes stop_codon:yes gene_type:complete